MAALSKILRSLQGDRLAFMCPGCGGMHAVSVGSGPGPRWGYNGNAEAPTFTPSILVNRGRANPAAEVCHSFVTDGRIQFLGDCTHALAGQTVDIPALDDA